MQIQREKELSLRQTQMNREIDKVEVIHPFFVNVCFMFTVFDVLFFSVFEKTTQ
jgi:hypothetical protein